MGIVESRVKIHDCILASATYVDITAGEGDILHKPGDCCIPTILADHLPEVITDEVPVMAKNLLKLPDDDFRRRSSDSSVGLMDTAEDLVDQLDSVAEILAEIEEKYPKDMCNVEENGNEDKKPNVFMRLRDGLESARTLISCLKREKWRLNKRQMSVEMRMGELEDYKSHLKEDMTSMNDTVEVLSFRVVQLENTLCEAQEVEETLEAEKSELQQRVVVLERKCSDLETHKVELLGELKEARAQISPTSLQKQNAELRLQVDMLREEDICLKEMLRHAESDDVIDDHDTSSVDSGIRPGGSTSSSADILGADIDLVDGDLGIPLKKDSNSEIERKRHLSSDNVSSETVILV